MYRGLGQLIAIGGATYVVFRIGRELLLTVLPTVNAGDQLMAADHNNVVNQVNTNTTTLGTVNSAAKDSHISSDGGGNLNVVSINLTTNGLTRIATAGPYTVTTTQTFFNHNLGATPDLCVLTSSTISSGSIDLTWDKNTITSSQVKCQSSNASGITGVYILSFKF